MRLFVRVFPILLAVQFVGYAGFAGGQYNNGYQFQTMNGKTDSSLVQSSDYADNGQASGQGRLDSGTSGRDTRVQPRKFFPLAAQRSQMRGDVDDQGPPNLRGMAAGQQLQPLNGNTDDSALHGGANDRGPLAGRANDEPNNMGRDTFQMNLTPHEVAMLGMHDIVVIVDKSYSMGTHDCPSGSGGFGGGGFGGGGGGYGSTGGGYGDSGFSNLSNDKKSWDGKDWSKAKSGGSGGLGGLLDLAAGLSGLSGGSGSSVFGSDQTRWEWCEHQLQGLTQQISRLPHRGITVVVFDSKYRAFDNVNPAQLPEIFSNFHPWNGTKLFPPLADQLDQYFQRRNRGNARPLLIAVITDGHPHDAKMLGPLLVQTTQQMRNPSEIAITLLQVGNDPEGEHFVDSLDHSLLSHGARFDIVRGKNFNELMHEGLTRALLDAINAPRRS